MGSSAGPPLRHPPDRPWAVDCFAAAAAAASDQKLKFKVTYAERGAPGVMLVSLCADGK